MKIKKNPKHVTVIYNSIDEDSPTLPPDRKVADQETVQMAYDIADGLKGKFQVELIEIPFTNPEKAAEIESDIVFNLCEGLGYSYACKVIEALDGAGIPYVGANSSNYRIGSDKGLLKEFLTREKIPTPRGQYFESPSAQIDPRLRFPLIIKPELEHGSVGITQESVVGDLAGLRRQLRKVIYQYGQGVVAEEFIEGRELQLTFVGNGRSLCMFPIKEILFVNEMQQKWHVVTFEAKWNENSAEYIGTPTVCPATNLDFQEIDYLETLGRKVFETTECQDYTRIDIRYDQTNKKAYVLDVNPNPDISSDAAVAKAAEVYGWEYQRLLEELVLYAWERVRQSKGAHEKSPIRTTTSFTFANN